MNLNNIPNENFFFEFEETTTKQKIDDYLANDLNGNFQGFFLSFYGIFLALYND